MRHGAVESDKRHSDVSSSADNLEALWLRVFSIEAAKRFHLVLMLCIAVLAFLAPAGAHGDPTTELALRFSLADARPMALASTFPLALAISYSFALIAALLGALSVCLTRVHINALQALIANRSVLDRTIVVVGLAMMNALPYMLELRPLDGQYSAYVSQGMEQSRLVLFVACEGLYMGCMATITWVLFEFTNAFRAIFRENSK